MENKKSSLSSFYEEVGKYPLLTREEENQLGKDVQGRDKAAVEHAVKKLVQSNLRLVIKIAQDFQGRGLDLEDLISEGNIGLHTAAKKFDPSKGAKFSYYSSFWIKQGILRAISNHGRLIRIPVCTLDKYFKIVGFINSHKKKHDKPPSNKKIAKKFNISVKRLMQILEAADSVVPLDSKIGGEGDTKIHEVIPDDIKLSPDESVGQAEEYKMLDYLVSRLSKREKLIIKNRFNLHGDGKRTLESLGKTLKITRERVRQIETVALNKLRVLAKDKLCV